MLLDVDGMADRWDDGCGQTRWADSEMTGFFDPVQDGNYMDYAVHGHIAAGADDGLLEQLLTHDFSGMGVCAHPAQATVSELSVHAVETQFDDDHYTLNDKLVVHFIYLLENRQIIWPCRDAVSRLK